MEFWLRTYRNFIEIKRSDVSNHFTQLIIQVAFRGASLQGSRKIGLTKRYEISHVIPLP